MQWSFQCNKTESFPFFNLKCLVDFCSTKRDLVMMYRLLNPSYIIIMSTVIYLSHIPLKRTEFPTQWDGKDSGNVVPDPVDFGSSFS